MALAIFNYSKICYIYNIYSSVNRGVNKKKGAILGYFNIRHIDSAITYRAQLFF